MSSLRDRLQSDLTDAIRARDEVTSATLRMALAAITTESVSGSAARDLTDDEVTAVLTREVKKRREAAIAYDEANRPELAARERAEEAVLLGYLPEPLSVEELGALIAAAVAEAQAAGLVGGRAMGAVMKQVQPQITGRADGRAVADEVKRQLGM